MIIPDGDQTMLEDIDVTSEQARAWNTFKSDSKNKQYVKEFKERLMKVEFYKNMAEN